MASEIGWELYRSFLGVLREGSLSGAARALGVAQPTVGRHVASLEKLLGVSLFTRSPSGLSPSEAAVELRPHAEEMESSAAALERTAASHGTGVRGVVRVTASEIIGVEVLPQMVAALRVAHPELRVELALTNRVQDLLRREADVAVRMTRPRQERLVARRIGEIVVGLHAHERYLERNGMPKLPADLARHSLIGFDQADGLVRNLSKSIKGLDRQTFAVSTDSHYAQLALVRSGAGIGFCQTVLAKRGSGLVRVLPGEFSLRLDTWITMHEDLRNSPRCRVMFDALVVALRAHIASQTG